MRFLKSLLLFASVVLAVPQTATAPPTPTAPSTGSTNAPVSGATNPITYPLGDQPIEAGKAITIKWDPTYGDKLDLVLRRGDSDNLDTIDIAKGIPNSGSYTWTPPKQLEAGSDYAIQITAGSATNYSPKFEVSSDGKGLSTTASAKSTPTPTPSSKSSTDDESSSTEKSSSTASSEEESSPSATPTTGSPIKPAADNNSSANVVRSPLALLVGVVAALAYFN